MNIHWSLSKTDCIIEEYILKLCENTPFHNFNITHACINNCQVTFILWKIKETHWSTLKRLFLMNIHWSSSKTDCTNEEYILKLCENTHFDNYNVSYVGRKNDQVIFIFMEHQGNSLINTERLFLMNIHYHWKLIAPINYPYPNYVKTVHFKFLISLIRNNY